MLEHFGLLREAVAAAGGREVKSLGDGLMVVFPSGLAALRCAVRMQQLLERRNRHAPDVVSVRIGVSLGDATHEEGDYFGEPVVQAARLCAAARGDQILCSELVRLMVGAREELSFSSVGALELKGLPEPLAACEVAWSSLDDRASALELPPALRSLPDTEFVGREIEAALLDRCWEAALDGEPQTAFVSGDPGVGKTRLLTRLASQAHDQGAVVLYGRCEEELGIPYLPWVEALSHYVRSGPLRLLRAHVNRHGGELARVVSPLSLRLPDVPPASPGDAETAPFAFFAAAADLLEAIGADHPVMIILDDLHWAERESMLLLQHLACSPAPRRRLIVCAFSQSELTDGHALSRLLAEMRRRSGVERITLNGLDEMEVVSMLQASAGHELDADGLELAGELARETEGNPFFIAEVVRHLVERGAVVQTEDGRWRVTGGLRDVGVPQSVCEVIVQRVRRLGAQAARTLGVASVIGRSFELELLARALGDASVEVLDVLEQAVAASILRESVQEPGRFTFSHALVEHALYWSLSATRRAHLHQRVGEVLEQLAGSDSDRVVELAHHFAAAVRPSSPQKAIVYAGRAGRRAIEQLAPVEAKRWFSRGLELLDLAPSPDEQLRSDLVAGLAEAERLTGTSARQIVSSR